MISLTSKHALNVLRALLADRDRRMTVAELSRETGVPAEYLSKVLRRLRRHRFVEGEKGWGGGFRIVPAALDRPIRDVVEVFEGRDFPREERCIFGLTPCDSSHPCALHADWERTRRAAQEFLSQRSVADLGSP